MLSDLFVVVVVVVVVIVCCLCSTKNLSVFLPPDYLCDISEVLLYLLLPPEDFHNKPFRYFFRVSFSGSQVIQLTGFKPKKYCNTQGLCKGSAGGWDGYIQERTKLVLKRH